jgi:uncharacterized protein YdiU (UPF0061 family)
MTNSKHRSFEQLSFDNRFVNELPGDPEKENFRRQVFGACYSSVKPMPVSAPRLLAYSPEMAETLHFDPTFCSSEEFVQVFAGNQVTQGMLPYAMCYGGHQFGHWAGQLGDGRAINLGEILDPSGQHWTLQLKGAGPTPYSRSADGLAVLRSSIREFLCSEAMHHLGVPTTRALSLILTGESVVRDMFYDGNPKYEPGAVVCRVAPSFVRFGNFQLFAARKDLDTLKRLVDFTIRRDFAPLGEPNIEVYGAWFLEVCIRTAEMIVHWQRVGFVHGVMNTDNLSILGLTIDYGPYGWLEDYDPDWTPNTTDAQGRRYRFGQQPQIAYWNLVQLANALYPLLGQTDSLQTALSAYVHHFDTRWNAMMADKLGLSQFEAATDETLISSLLTLLQAAEVDMTLFYRKLSTLDENSSDDAFQECLDEVSYRPLTTAHRQQAAAWFNQYQARLHHNAYDSIQRQQRMNQVNPRYVPRNYLIQQAIERAEDGDFSSVHSLLALFRRPYDEQEDQAHFATKRPEWAKHKAGCSMLSCSS